MSQFPQNLIERPAYFSEDGLYRYWLRRNRQPSLLSTGGKPRPCLFCLLNPSKADGVIDDKTSIRCVGFTEALGYDITAIVNPFALVSTSPSDLYSEPDPIGPLNDEAIMTAALWAVENDGIIILGWGNHGRHLDRDQEVLELLSGLPLHCLASNENGTPQHPLYLSASTSPMPYGESDRFPLAEPADRIKRICR